MKHIIQSTDGIDEVHQGVIKRYIDIQNKIMRSFVGEERMDLVQFREDIKKTYNNQNSSVSTREDTFGVLTVVLMNSQRMEEA